MKSIPFRLRSPLVGAILATMIAPCTQGAQFNWTGNGSTNNFAEGANWQGSTAPSGTASDTVLSFAGSTRLSPVQNIATTMRVQSLRFETSAGAFVLGGNTLNLQTGTAAPGVEHLTAANITIGNALVLTNNTTFSGTSTAQMKLLGAVSGAGTLLKTSDGTLSFEAGASLTSPQLQITKGTVSFASGSSALNTLVRVDGGTFRLDGGSVNVGTGAFFQVGSAASATGTANLLSGTLTATESDIGNVAGATGNVLHSGGTHQVSGRLYLGVTSGSTGNYTLSDNGILNTGGTTVGHFGTGTFTQNGGTHDINGTLLLGTFGNQTSGTYQLNGGILQVSEIQRGTNAAGTAIFNFNGGTLRPKAASTTFFREQITAQVQAGGAIIDTAGFDTSVSRPLVHDTALGSTPDGGLKKRGAGTLTLTGASNYTGQTIVEAGTLRVADGGSLTNSFLLVEPGGTFLLAANGTVNVGTGTYIAVGSTAGALPSTIVQTGGSMTSAALDIGNVAGATGVYNHSGGTNTVSTQLTVGLGSGAKGTYNLSGNAALNVPGSLLIGFTGGEATINQSGGTITSSIFHVGQTIGGVGRYTLSGGQASASTRLAIGRFGSGELRQTGGNLAVPGEFLVAFGPASTGRYELAGGTVSTVDANIGVQGVGVMEQTGGLLAVSGNLTVGSSASATGSYRLAGGVLRTSRVRGGAGSSTFAFDGGTLQATVDEADWMSGLDTLHVLAGGARFDTNGRNMVLSSPLAHDTGDTLGGLIDGGLTKAGAGDLRLAALNTFNGGVNILGGSVTTADDANLGAASGPVSIANGARLIFTSSTVTTGRTFNLANAVLTPATNGTLTLAGATVNGGFLNSNGGTLQLGAGTTLNFTTVQPGANVTQTAATNTWQGVTFSGNLSQPAGATLNFQGGYISPSAKLTLGGVFNTSSGVEITGRLIVSGTLAHAGPASLPLVLGYGSNTTITASGSLSGNSIELNDARLELAGTHTGQLNINDGSLVTGNGTFGTVSVRDGGVFSPGSLPDITNLSALTLEAGGIWKFELNGINPNAGTNQDFLSIANQLTIGAVTPGHPIILSLASLNAGYNPGLISNFAANVPFTLTLATAAGISGFDSGKFFIDTGDFYNDLQGGSFAISQSPDQKSLLLTFTPVPEPGSLALLMATLPLLGGRRMRRRR